MTAPRTDPFEQNFPEVRVHIGARARRCLGLTHAGAVGAVRCGGGQGVESYLEYGAAFALAFSRRGTMLAAGRADGHCIVWDFDTRSVARGRAPGPAASWATARPAHTRGPQPRTRA